MLDRYLDRPSKNFKISAYKVIDQLCFAEFFSYYYIVKKPVGNSENNCQPVLLDDTIMESNHAETHFPKVVALMNYKEKLHWQKVKADLRYHQSSPTKHTKILSNMHIICYFRFTHSRMKSNWNLLFSRTM